MSWSQESIGSLCLDTETVDPRERPETTFRYIDISSIDKDAKVIAAAPEILGKDAPSRARKKIRAGDILVSTVRPNLNAVAPVPADLDGQVASTGFCVLRVNEEKLDHRYLLYWTITPPFAAYLVSNVRGAHYPAVTDVTVKSATIPLPLLPEQRRIVEILDQADALRRMRREADSLAERILPALFYGMFGDPVKNEKGWESKTLNSVAVLGPQYGANASSIDWRPGLPRYIRITDIDDDGRLRDDEMKSLETNEWDEFLLENGDIVFARSGATVGKVYMHRDQVIPCVFAGYLIRFRLDRSKVNPWVLFALTRTPYYRSWVASKKRTAAQPNINGQEYASLVIPIPPMELQEDFASSAEELIALQARQDQSRRNVTDTFDTLLHRAFTGELTARWREKHLKESEVR